MNDYVEGVCESREFDAIWNKYISEGYMFVTTSSLPGHKELIKYGFYLKQRRKENNDPSKFKNSNKKITME